MIIKIYKWEKLVSSDEKDPFLSEKCDSTVHIARPEAIVHCCKHYVKSLQASAKATC